MLSNMVIFRKATMGMWSDVTDLAVLGNFFKNEPSTKDMVLELLLACLSF